MLRRIRLRFQSDPHLILLSVTPHPLTPFALLLLLSPLPTSFASPCVVHTMLIPPNKKYENNNDNNNNKEINQQQPRCKRPRERERETEAGTSSRRTSEGVLWEDFPACDATIPLVHSEGADMHIFTFSHTHPSPHHHPLSFFRHSMNSSKPLHFWFSFCFFFAPITRKSGQENISPRSAKALQKKEEDQFSRKRNFHNRDRYVRPPFSTTSLHPHFLHPPPHTLFKCI